MHNALDSMPPPEVTPPADFAPRLLDVWRRHDEILVYLLDQVPLRGLSAVPLASRGRSVAAQFAHVHRVRTAWVQQQNGMRLPEKISIEGVWGRWFYGK